jgi:beta-lactam-binding protein with PASTA domain
MGANPEETVRQATPEASLVPAVAGTTAGRSRRALLVLFKYSLLGGGLVATAFVSAFVTFSFAIRGNNVTVPDLEGSDLASAGRSLAALDLNLKPEGRRHDPEVPLDHITAQDPPAGAGLKRGRSVKVWVSLGPPQRTTPRLEGESLRSAQLILEQNSFTLRRVAEVNSKVYSPDTIIAQDPPPYTAVGESAEVAVLVSRGYSGSAYVMPDFIGREISEVLDRIRSASLTVNSIRYQEYPGLAKGLVVRQTPVAGSKVYPRDRIVLYVSKGS